jgi:hypothetical protein
MEILKFTTQIEGKSLAIPEHILKQIIKGAEVEVTLKAMRQSLTIPIKVEQVIEEIERQMNQEFPNLKGPINDDLAGLAGISSNTERELAKYSDTEILGMVRMEKHLKKGEISESLF